MKKWQKIVLVVVLLVSRLIVFSVATYVGLFLHALYKAPYTYETTIKDNGLNGKVVLKEWETLKGAGVDVYYIPKGSLKKYIVYGVTYNNSMNADVICNDRYSYKIEDGTIELTIDADFRVHLTNKEGAGYAELFRIVSSVNQENDAAD